MEKILINAEIEQLLKERNNFEWKQIFIKRVGDAVHFDALEIMENNQEKLKEDYYAFVNRIYHDENEKSIAIGSDYCADYQTLYNYFVQRKKGNTQVFLECLEAIMDLDNLGLDYWDIHIFNILVNKENHIKLVDLDSTKVRKYNAECRMSAFMDMIIESYFFFDMRPSSSASMINFGFNLHSLVPLMSYYSPEVIRLIHGTFQNTNVPKDVEHVLKELEDQEKINDIRNQVKKLRPYWF